MKLQLLAIPLIVALIASPMFAAAASGSISFSSPTAGSTIKTGTSYTIAGTITPTPGLPDNVFIEVTNTATGDVVDANNVAVGTGGAFSYPTIAGSNFLSGTYTITATDSNGATGSESITISGTSTSTPSGFVSIVGPSFVLPGQSANLWIYSSAPGSVTAWVLPVGATTTTALTTTRVSPNPGGLDVYTATYSVSASAATGAYLVGALVTNITSNFAASNIGSFTVQGGVATATAVTTLTTDVTAISTSLAAVTTSLTGITTSLAGITTSLGSVSSAVSSLTTSVNGLTGLSAQVTALGTQLTTVGNNVNTIGTGLTSLTTTVNGISSSLTSLTSTVSSMQSTLGSITSTLSTISSQVSSMSTTVGTLGNLSGQLTTVNNAVSNSQTYILVVAALVVITLVLELAILIRKMS